MASIIVLILSLITFIYDIISYPIYYIIQQPSKTLQGFRNPKEAKTKLISKEGGLTYRCTRAQSKVTDELLASKVSTLDGLFRYACKKNGSKRCLGVRDILDEEDEVQPNGKVFKKYSLGDYLWKTYDEVDQLASSVSRGFRQLGIKPKDKICIFAETRPEWLISAMAAFRQNVTIVTLYATLGDEGVIHGLNQTGVEYVVTSHELLPKFKNILKECPKVKHLVYMEDPLKKTDTTGFPDRVQVHAFVDVLSLGSKSSFELVEPTENDIAIIMYTSGSTGTPKGVLLSHKNIFCAVKGFCDAVSPVYPTDCYIAYLPLAHVLELIGESFFFVSGVPIGYSSALTMTDTSGKIKRGGKGDATILQPTFMTCVPLILDRIYKGIQEKVKAGGPTSAAVFKFFYDYRLKWYYRGFRTPIVDSLIFSKVKQIVGGRVRCIPAGGAPLSPDVQEFIRNTIGTAVMQGYGLTETCCCGTVTLFSDMSVGRVGQPIGGADIKLVDWEEGNYRVDDKPYPRGEVWIGGDMVGNGYYDLPEATASEFFEQNGKRWFKTGDIALMEPDGVLKIIDRKKDLVKLQFGEYVSLGKVESELKSCPYVDNICIYGDSMKTYCVAIVVPVQPKLEQLATSLGVTWQSLEELCKNEKVIQGVLKEIVTHARKSKLQKFEIPGALKLCPELWTPESGLVTAAFKLKRKPVQEFYQRDINVLYAAGPMSV